MRAAFAIIIGLTALCPLPSTAEDTACHTMDLGSVPDIRACLDLTDGPYDNAQTEVEWFFSRPTFGCPQARKEVYRRAVNVLAPDLGRHPNWDDVNTVIADRFGSADALSCTTIAAMITEQAGTPPVWSNCVGYDDAPDKSVFVTECIVSYSERATFEQAKSDPAFAAIPPETRYPRSCNGVARDLDRIFRTINERDRTLEPSFQHLPASFEEPDCDALAPLFERAKEARSAERIRLREAYAERMRQMREQGFRPVNILAEVDKSYQTMLDDMSAQAFAAWDGRSHAADNVEPQALRQAIVREIHAIFPQETNSFAGLTGQTRHTTGGIETRTSVPGAPKVNYGVRAVDGVDCTPVSGGQSTCDFSLSVASLTTLSSAASGPEAGVWSSMLNAFNPVRSRDFSETLVHDGVQWRIEGTSSALREFLIPPVVTAAPRDNVAPEVCLVYQAWGSSVC